jgi:hypothetical protein
MSVKITTNHQPREILDWIPESQQKNFDYIDWTAVMHGRDSVSFVKYRNDYWDLNCTEGSFPHDNDWWYNSQSFGFGILFNVTEIDGEMMVICGTYIISD